MLNQPSPVVIGLDPGFDRVGWAIIQQLQAQWQVVDCGCIQTSKTAPRFDRYQQIELELTALIEHYQPRRAGIEQLYVARNTASVIHVAEARGVTLGCLLRHQVQVHELNPSTVKSAITGNGRADKTAMRKMVLLQLGSTTPIIRTKIETAIDDTIDAIGIALTAATVRSSV